MKRKILAIIISLIIISISIFFVILPKKEFSETENRYLEKFPSFSFGSLKSGEYTQKIEKYLADHFPLRDEFMGAKTVVYKLIGQTKIDGVYLGKDEYLLEEFVEPENTEKIVNVLNNFAKKIPNCNINFMLIPTSVEINKDKLPKHAINSSQLEEINKYKDKINFKLINVYDLFTKVTDKIQLYYRLDHHWTTFGAFVAYLQYCNNEQIKPQTDFNIIKVSNNFNGTLYSKTNDYSLTPDEIYKFDKIENEYIIKYVATNRVTNTLYEEKYLNTKDKYSYFLDNNHALIEIENKNINLTEEIVVIKDSYANAFIPFLVNNYKKVHVIDPRYYKTDISEYINKNNIKNVLFLYNIKTIDDDLGIISVK